MGSVLAGVKAGAVASVYFAGSISLFNILLLYAFKSQVLSYLLQNYCHVHGGAAGVAGPPNRASPSSCAPACFSTTCQDGRRWRCSSPVAIGVYFDFLPGRTYMRRTLLVALIMLVAMLFLGVYGLVTSTVQEVSDDRLRSRSPPSSTR